MKKQIVNYTSESESDGWAFDEHAKPLQASSLKKLGIADPAEGQIYDRHEKDGNVQMTPSKRGGKRKGAGRKASGNVRLQLLVPVETRKILEKLAKRDHVSLSEAFRRSIALLGQ